MKELMSGTVVKELLSGTVTSTFPFTNLLPKISYAYLTYGWKQQQPKLTYTVENQDS